MQAVEAQIERNCGVSKMLVKVNGAMSSLCNRWFPGHLLEAQVTSFQPKNCFSVIRGAEKPLRKLQAFSLFCCDTRLLLYFTTIPLTKDKDLRLTELYAGSFRYSCSSTPSTPSLQYQRALSIEMLHTKHSQPNPKYLLKPIRSGFACTLKTTR